MKNSLKLRLAALTVSTATLLSGCETCTSVRRMPQSQGCYQSSCGSGYYSQAPAQCYQPEANACSPAGCGTVVPSK